jgi:hypothetical protein
VVDGVAVSVPDEFNSGGPQTYRCRVTKEYVFEPNCCSPLISGHGLPGFANRDELAG